LNWRFKPADTPGNEDNLRLMCVLALRMTTLSVWAETLAKYAREGIEIHQRDAWIRR
jgi:hypothetical protein